MDAYKIIKAWQSEQDSLILSLSPIGSRRHELHVKKIFLSISVEPTSFGLTINYEKPDFKIKKNALIEIFRKFAGKLVIGDILKTSSQNDYFVLMYHAKGQPAEWILRIEKTRPPEIALFDKDGTIYVRYGKNGTYTKKKQIELPKFYKPNGEVSDNFVRVTESIFDDAKKREALHDDFSRADQISDQSEPEKVEIGPLQRKVLQKLRRRLKTAEKAFLKATSSIPSQKEIDSVTLQANLLQTYSYLIKENDCQILPKPELSGQNEDIVIDIDPEKSIGSNIESYYVKSKKLKKARLIGQEKYEKNKKSIDHLKSDITMLQGESLSYSDLQIMCRNHNVKWDESTTQSSRVNLQETSAKPFKTFRSSTGHQILVGKGPKENDILTKSAKANDYWIHSAGSAGSHIIVPCTKEIRTQMPDTLLREAALLAIYYSKFKSDLAGETYIARKSQIKKQKGMPPGLWNVERCKTIFWRFEEHELKAILNRLEK